MSNLSEVYDVLDRCGAPSGLLLGGVAPGHSALGSPRPGERGQGTGPGQCLPMFGPMSVLRLRSLFQREGQGRGSTACG